MPLSSATRPVGELVAEDPKPALDSSKPGCRLWQPRDEIENVDVIVFPFRPPVSKIQKLTGSAMWGGSSGGKVT